MKTLEPRIVASVLDGITGRTGNVPHRGTVVWACAHFDTEPGNFLRPYAHPGPCMTWPLCTVVRTKKLTV